MKPKTQDLPSGLKFYLEQKALGQLPQSKMEPLPKLSSQRKPPSKAAIKKAWIVWEKDSINVSADTLAIILFDLFGEWRKGISLETD